MYPISYVSSSEILDPNVPFFGRVAGLKYDTGFIYRVRVGDDQVRHSSFWGGGDLAMYPISYVSSSEMLDPNVPFFGRVAGLKYDTGFINRVRVGDDQVRQIYVRNLLQCTPKVSTNNTMRVHGGEGVASCGSQGGPAVSGPAAICSAAPKDAAGSTGRRRRRCAVVWWEISSQCASSHLSVPETTEQIALLFGRS
jgi:hypothetical protein